MTPDYHADLETVAHLLAEFTRKYRGSDIEAQPALADSIVRDMAFAVAHVATEEIFQEQAAVAVKREAAAGYLVERSPWIAVATLFGKILLKSPYMLMPGRSGGRRPVNETLRVRGGGRTVALERVLCDFGVDSSFEKAAYKLKEHYGITLHRTTIRRTVLKHGSEVEIREMLRAVDARCTALPEGPSVPFVAEMDGSCVRTGRLEQLTGDELTPVRRLPRRRRATEWRDCRLILVRLLNERKCRFAGGIHDFREVVDRGFAAARSAGLTATTHTVRLTDGGNGLREAMDAGFEGGQHILDKPHLAHHLDETASALGLDTDPRELAREWLTRISAGDAQGVIADLQALDGPGEKRARQMAAYLAKFADCVHYDEYVAAGLPVGSGEIESAHKGKIQARLKLPGCWWSVRGANRLLSLRLERDNGWDGYWQLAAA